MSYWRWWVCIVLSNRVPYVKQWSAFCTTGKEEVSAHVIKQWEMVGANGFMVGSFIILFTSSEGPWRYLSTLLQDYPSWLCIVLHGSSDWCWWIFSKGPFYVQYKWRTGKRENHCCLLRNKEIGSSRNHHWKAKEDVGLPTILLQITAF